LDNEFAKVYSPAEIESRWSRFWVEKKLYRPSDNPSGPRFALSLPPPNITGSLHMGHMLEHTEIDALMRWRRMRGQDVLWLPGMDHASIATQMIVEVELGREALPNLEGAGAKAAWRREGQKRRREMGYEKFIERCWKWKEESGGTIRKQMERMGASCDWTRDRFTMDPAYSAAVVEVFVRLYDEGLIYRGKYIVNWCPRCGTAVSDLEVAHEERPGKLWHLRYPFSDGSGYLTAATTRPETMLGDTALAVSPSDERYRSTVGRRVVLPILKREIRVIADDAVDPKFGTGVVKVTPAHDPNDFEISRRHDLRAIEVIDEQARMTAEAGPYQGLDRYEARERLLADLTEQGLLEKVEDYALSVGTCQRCKTVVEPRLSEQWFMKMQPLAAPAIRAVVDGRVQIVPENCRKIYLDWMAHIHDWCISRQLWWGHRIPAWFCDACGKVIVARETPVVCPGCKAASLRPETDVLDTWFSSALWPFVTLGWPEETADLARFYPNDLMIMGFDILFFWGARMMMMGLKFTGQVPFHELYVHALVRDAEKQKMSKTKGNVLDPLEVVDKFGTDAVRFALAISAAPGTDITFSDSKVSSYRAFANKIWNAGRFILMNLAKLPKTFEARLADALQAPPGTGYEPVEGAPADRLADAWAFSRLLTVSREMDRAFAEYRFHEVAAAIYHFFWHEFCDWYVEWVKPGITRTAAAPELPEALPVWTNLLRAFDASLHLLHPLMPFITEELWHRLPRSTRELSISLSQFDLVSERAAKPISEKQFQAIQELVVAARNAEAEEGLQTARPSAQVASEDLRMLELCRDHQEAILRLAGLEAMNFERRRMPAGPGVIPVSTSLDLRLLAEKTVDRQAERARLLKEKVRTEHQLEAVEAQLNNPEFLHRAPQEVVRTVTQRRAVLAELLRKIEESLGPLE